MINNYVFIPIFLIYKNFQNYCRLNDCKTNIKICYFTNIYMNNSIFVKQK